jgi:hypothetical protein
LPQPVAPGGVHLVLIDIGIGLHDMRNPVERLGQPLIYMAGFQFNQSDTVVCRIERGRNKRDGKGFQAGSSLFLGLPRGRKVCSRPMRSAT